jgi:hypothetical protein
MTPVIKEWEEIYNKFVADTRGLIEKAGGTDFLCVKALAGDNYHQLVPHLDYYGRLGDKRKAEDAASLEHKHQRLANQLASGN